MVGLTIAFAIFMLYFEYTATSENIKEVLKVALVTNAENARMILGTIVGGIISLTVFSFSMVMVVLNRASETLSPRVIPGIISHNFHQIILGFYLSTIIYSLMLMININAVEKEMEVPSLGILLGMIFAIGSLGLFVYFIDSISKSIQVDNILDDIFKKTRLQLRRFYFSTKDLEDKELNVAEWHSIRSSKAGYFNDLETNGLLSFLTNKNLKLKLNFTKGFFIPKGYPFIAVNKDITKDKKLTEELLAFIKLETEEHLRDHFNFGFKQITEIAVKALSPGINDPGTAHKGLDLLTILFRKRMELPDFNIKRDKKNEVRIIRMEWPVEHMLFQNIGAIREYGKRDISIMINLLNLIKNLIYADKENQYSEILIEQAESIIQDVENNNRNFMDRKIFNVAVEKLNEISNKKFELLEINRKA